MKIQGEHYRTIWLEGDEVVIIDQRHLPFRLVTERISSVTQLATAIKEMRVRGAPLKGVAGAFGAYLAARELSQKKPQSTGQLKSSFDALLEVIAQARPTAVNLRWAIEQQRSLFNETTSWASIGEHLKTAAVKMADDDVAVCESIGRHGLPLIQEIYRKKKNGIVNILTHCNAGWLATIDFGTATSPIYQAQRQGIPIHVWVDETRPRLQGSKLTAFELGEENIPHTVIVDNAGGHLMQHGQVDICIVGTDRTTRTGDVANKIGTYLKALAARHNNVPFYAAVPSSSIDWNLTEGRDIPIEERNQDEVLCTQGLSRTGESLEVRIAAPESRAANPSFDVTPRDLMTGLITERGVCQASEDSILKLFPERRNA